jgi:chromosome segregation protein
MDVYLDKLELHGFKSFPEKTVIKLHKGITAIIGPNGCGKSNIVDSIFWVLGEQRIKNLRGENSEDLIFNGNINQKPLGMTEVGAFFMKNGEQIYIARRYFRSGESKYILNDKYCRNRDIQDILFDMHMGEKKYFIFEQGSIDKLISLKPTEKRILIEEAAGILQYLERKKETANKLIIAQQNLENIEILSADKEIRLRELKNQVNYVKRYRNQKNERNDFLKALLKKKHTIYQQEFQKYKAELEKLLNQESLTAREISTAQKDLMTREESRWQLDRELKEHQKTIYEINRQIMANKNEIEKLKQQHGFIGQKIAEIKNSLKTGKEEVGRLDEEISLVARSAASLESESMSEESDHQDLEERLSILNEKLTEATARDNGLAKKIERLQSESSRITLKLREVEKRVIRLENEVDTKKSFVVELNRQIGDEEIAVLEKKWDQSVKELEAAKSRHVDIETKHRQGRTAIDELTDNLKNLENEIKNLDNQKAKYLEIKKKMAAQDTGGLETANRGLLQDHIEADKNYRKLLENFFYEEIDALIPHHNHDVLKGGGSKFLLKKDNGESLPPEILQEEGVLGPVEGLFRLKEPEIGGYLKNGVLVKDLQTGIRIFAQYGVDVVTQEAEVISRQGVLIRSREKGILDVIDEIREIDQKRTSSQERLKQLKEKLEVETGEQATLAAQLEDRLSVVNRLQETCQQQRHELESLKKNRQANLERIGHTESEIQRLAKEKEQLQHEFDALETRQADLDKQLQQLKGERETYLTDIQRMKEEVNQTEKRFLQKESALRLLKEKLAHQQQQQKELKKNKMKLIDQIAFNEKEVVRLSEELKAIEARVETAKEGSKELESKKTDLEAAIQDQENRFQALNSDIKGNSAMLDEKRRSLEEIKEHKNKIEIELSSIKKDLFQLEEISFQELNTELANIQAEAALVETEMAELEEKLETGNRRLFTMRESNRLNFSAESEYEILLKEHGFLISQKEDIVKSIQNMHEAIEKIDAESRQSFMEAFTEIKDNFVKNFKILFEGGEAEMTLTEPDDVLESGLDIKAQPPGKKLQSLQLLSGGEKALSSLAFLFSLFEYKPSPFCVFDEVDASLDESNVKRFLKFVHKLKEKTQFLVITHNFKTMEEADYIYGITMNEPGISTIYSMKMTGKDKFRPLNN